MQKIHAKGLSLEGFARYGCYALMLDPKAEKIGEEPVEFFRDMLPLDLGTSTTASFSVCRVSRRRGVVDVSEFHNGTEEGILPLDADVLIHVAAATPGPEVPAGRIEVFRVPRGTFVALKRGVWHHAPFALGAEAANVLIVLPERAYAVDCTVREINPEERLEITS
jgi:ureidoglycolate hydrolase